MVENGRKMIKKFDCQVINRISPGLVNWKGKYKALGRNCRNLASSVSTLLRLRALYFPILFTKWGYILLFMPTLYVIACGAQFLVTFIGLSVLKHFPSAP